MRSPLGLILLIIVIVLVVGGMPRWGYVPAGWGWYPSSALGVVLVLLLVLLLLGLI